MHSRSNWKCWFFKRRENQSTWRINLSSRAGNQQRTQSTYGIESGNWTQATLVGGKCSHWHSTISAVHAIIAHGHLHAQFVIQWLLQFLQFPFFNPLTSRSHRGFSLKHQVPVTLWSCELITVHHILQSTISIWFLRHLHISPLGNIIFEQAYSEYWQGLGQVSLLIWLTR